MKEMVLFHKTPALWNKQDFLQQFQEVAGGKIEHKSLDNTSDLHILFDSDNYVKICVEICKILDFEHLHIVQGFSENEQRNWISGEENGRFEISDNMTYWCLNSPAQLRQFMNSDVIFTRGNYAFLHDFLATTDDKGSNPIWLHYPATALMFPHLEIHIDQLTASLDESKFDSRVLSEQVTGMIVEHQLKPSLGHDSLEKNLHNLWNHFENQRTRVNPFPYDIVLIDDKSSFLLYKQVFPESLIVPFVKPVCPTDIKINYHREYDLMFCGTTLQSTKNHLQFIALLDRLDRESDQFLRIAIAGDRGDLPAFTQSLEKEYKNLFIENFGEVSRSKLFDLYNQTRTLIVMSGRDCNPRIIQEAGICGVFIIASDTLSDGTEILKEEAMIGSVIPTKKSSWFYQKNGNVVFEVNTSFAQKVLRIINNARSPYLVHEIAEKRYSLKETSTFIAEQIYMLR